MKKIYVISLVRWTSYNLHTPISLEDIFTYHRGQLAIIANVYAETLSEIWNQGVELFDDLEIPGISEWQPPNIPEIPAENFGWRVIKKNGKATKNYELYAILERREYLRIFSRWFTDETHDETLELGILNCWKDRVEIEARHAAKKPTPVNIELTADTMTADAPDQVEPPTPEQTPTEPEQDKTPSIANTKRQRLTNSEIKKREKLVADQKASGLTVKMFCRERKIEETDYNAARVYVDRHKK